MLSAAVFLLSETLMNSQTLIFAGLGGLVSEKSGVVNIGLEGIMAVGAFVGATVAFLTGSPLLALFAGGLGGALLALLHAIFTVYLKSEQIITGMALNFLGPAITMILSFYIFKALSTPPIEVKLPIFLDGVLSKSSIIFQIFGKRISVYFAICSVFFFHILFKYTKVGLRIKACGESPEVLESLGVNIYKIRFFCVLLSGFLAGLGGSLITTVITSSYMQGIVGGQGFIAIVMLIFGGWTPIGVMYGSFLFAFVRALSILLSQTPLIAGFVSPKFLVILPYLVVILSLVFISKKVSAPKALGVPFKTDAN